MATLELIMTECVSVFVISSSILYSISSLYNYGIIHVVKVIAV